MKEMASMLPVTLFAIYGLGYLGYLVFRSLRIPAAALAGSIVVVAIMTGLGVHWASVPPYITVFLQTFIGIMVGCRFNRETIPQFRKLLLPGGIVAFWMVGTGLGIGFELKLLTNLDLGSALFAAAPGGLAEMGSFAQSYGLDVPVVLLTQFIRLLFVYFSVPVVVRLVNRNGLHDSLPLAAAEDSKGDARKLLKASAITFLLGFGGGLAAWYVGMPAGGILGSMFSVGFLRSFGYRLEPLPVGVINYALVGLGATLGLTFTPSVVMALQQMMLPVILISVQIVLSGLLLGYIVHRMMGWDIITALMACAPAGVVQMSALALDMDADAVKVGLVQIFRLIGILLILPALIALLIAD